MAYVKAAEREEQIVAAAIRVFSSVGVPATTLRLVAAEAGIPLGTPHYVFPSKDQMLRAVIAAIIDTALDTVRAGLEVDRGLAMVEADEGLHIMQYELASIQSVRRARKVWPGCNTTGTRCSSANSANRQLALMDGLIIQYGTNPDPSPC